MKSFAYASPTTEGEALSLLSESGDIEILAGGTDLVGLMKKMIITPDLVVNILDIPSLKDHRAARRRRDCHRCRGHAR